MLCDFIDHRTGVDFIERKPYAAGTNNLSNTAFVPVEKPKEKNPMLEPRQGIKILPTDDAK